MERPSLELDWELGIFKALRGLWRAVMPSPPPAFDADRAAQLEGLTPRLTVLASVLAGQPVKIQPARGVGGVRGRTLLLPQWIATASDPESNAGLYLLRAAIGAEMIRAGDGMRVPMDPAVRFLAGLEAARQAEETLRRTLGAFGAAMDGALALALAERDGAATELRDRAALEEALLRDTLRGQQPWLDTENLDRLRGTPERGPACPPLLLWGRLIPAALDASEVGVGEDPEAQSTPAADGTEAEAPPVEELVIVHKPEGEEKELPVHVFEKVETAEAFAGGFRQMDGSDELSDHLEALSEVDLSHLIRGGEQAQSLYRAEIGVGAQIPDVGRIEPGEEAVLYDEWDAKRGVWRADWCSVYPTTMPPGDARWAVEAVSRHRRLIERLHRQLSARRAARRPRGRQLDGEDVDVDAVVNARADVAAGHTPDRRMYIRRRPCRRDLATTVLLDLSLSADAWIEGRRVLDVTREAALVLGEVAHRLGDRLQVLGFASHTRNRVRVWEICGWRDPWRVGRARLGILQPQGYTRIGPAIRHAAAGLAAVEARDRLLLVISDGKPTDYDRYEGDYGVADIRQAIRQARSQRVRTHALAVAATGRDYLPAMLGPGGWSILPHPDNLLEALAMSYARLS